MKSEKLNTKIEVYICNYKREGSECCFDKGAKELTDDIKKWAKQEHKNDIKVFRSGCLGRCEQGIAMMTYPEKNMVTEITKTDAEEIKKGLKEALNKL